MKALTDEEMLNVNLRIPDAVSKVLGLQRVLLDVNSHVAEDGMKLRSLLFSDAHGPGGLALNVGEWTEALCFTLALLSDLRRSYTAVKVAFEPGSTFARLFERSSRSAHVAFFEE